VEAHLILDEPISDFYNEVMRLELLGFLRSEKKFDSFPDLVQAISNDVTNSNTFLDKEPYASFQNDVFFTEASSKVWTGKDGGDQLASWEFEQFDPAK
jgi:riboflavin kinase